MAFSKEWGKLRREPGVTLIPTGEREQQPDPAGNRAQRRMAAKRRGELGKRDRRPAEEGPDG